jgi:hypothetical protein
MIELGSRVKDTITGLVGIAVARTDWLYQCRRIAVQPEALHDGKPLDIQWFDEPQLEVVATAGSRSHAGRLPVTGGPARSVPPSRDPSR